MTNRKLPHNPPPRTDDPDTAEKPATMPPPSGVRSAQRIELMPTGYLVEREPPLTSALRRHISWASRAMAQREDGDIDAVVFERELSYALHHLSALTVDVAALEDQVARGAS